MPARPQPIDDYPAAFQKINDRLRNIDDALRDRLLPPGYRVNIVAGNVVITSPSETTVTLVFP